MLHRQLRASLMTCVVAWSALGATSSSVASDEWVSLFDGTSLNGWQANESADSFSVVDGTLVVRGPRGHLFFVGEDGVFPSVARDAAGMPAFRNFVFEADVMTKAKANSGVFFHTKFQPSGWPSHGYEVQVNSTHGDTIKTGSLYGVVKVNPAPSTDDAWFKLRVEVRGRRVTTSVDGTVTVDFLEPRDVQGTRRLSKGTLALQAHDPGSEVHYRNLRLRVLPDEAAMSRADWVALREGTWFDRMDYGPFLTSVVNVNRDDTVLKGITVELNPERDALVTFDTDLLRMAVGGPGHLELRGTPFDGRHGTQPTVAEAPWFHVAPGPGVASPDGSWDDPRQVDAGPVPDAWGRYRGLTRHGDQVVFEYDVGSRRVRETPSLQTFDGHQAIVRSFLVEPGDAVRIALADETGRRLQVMEGRVAVSSPALDDDAVDDTKWRVVLGDRSSAGFDQLAVGAPSASDDVDASRSSAKFRWVGGFAAPHAMAGADETTLPRLNDGDWARNNDDTSRNAWLEGKSARVVLDLDGSSRVERVNTFTWHRTNRSPQNYRLYGTYDLSADESADDLGNAGWSLLATVDTRDLGLGGRHGSTVSDRVHGLGALRKLLWDWTPVSNNEGQFLSEIDVYFKGHAPGALKPPAARGESRPLTAVRMGDDAAQLTAVGERLVLDVPASDQSRTIHVALTRSVESAAAGLWRDADWAAPDFEALAQPGPALWPESLTVAGRVSKEDEPYVVDDVPLPLENPWLCSMRVGAFDFFADGDRAALCTWNGDVWVVSGLAGDWSSLTWRRFAGGLFEPLGLCIVDDVVHVNGRDQVTRLHDTNDDGEADFYECFNNDVMTTANFHEFTFDLQRDAEGNFYFSKGGPVRSGGRGFERIVPHHGTVMKLTPDGKTLSVYATGMRAPNGIGVSPDGRITASDNEGTWVPHCKLHWLSEGSFQGVVDLAHREEVPLTYNPPLCWFPMEVDNSGGGQVWVTSDQFGPLGGDLLHLSYGTSSIYRVLWEERDGVAQGGVVRLPVQLGSSAMRARFHPTDGQMYVCGLRGWQTNAARLAAFQRVRYTGKEYAAPCALHAREKTLSLTFEQPLDRELAEDLESWALEGWNYVWGPQYGSPEVSALDPDEAVLEQALETEMKSYRKRDEFTVSAARLSEDGRTVELTVEDLRPIMQMKVTADLETTEGELVQFELFSTIHWLGAAGAR